MIKHFKFIVSIILLSVFTGCAHKHSYFIHQESITINPEKRSTNPIVVQKQADQTEKAFPLAAVGTAVLSFAYDQVVATVEKEAKKYSAVTEGARSDADFYEATVTTNGIN